MHFHLPVPQPMERKLRENLIFHYWDVHSEYISGSSVHNHFIVKSTISAYFHFKPTLPAEALSIECKLRRLRLRMEKGAFVISPRIEGFPRRFCKLRTANQRIMKLLASRLKLCLKHSRKQFQAHVPIGGWEKMSDFCEILRLLTRKRTQHPC